MSSSNEAERSIGSIIYYSSFDEREAFRKGFYEQLNGLAKNNKSHNIQDLVQYCTYNLIMDDITNSNNYIINNQQQITDCISNSNIINTTYQSLCKLSKKTQKEYENVKMQSIYNVYEKNGFIHENRTNSDKIKEILKLQKTKSLMEHYIR